ncbi:exonuclease domain-containing protein [Muriicola jejuensis]|uniref:GIY-YIG nuclease family protein n=1 Tax=Muriicola jejuensis TaxID=504488 RepID=A0A6P0UDE8_9FLAO|nr:exonuclease domain-containing protein [Muriicola jejuensis]NER11077.1 GIY-YIG nuclease family protein [Muriicola jejuensis]
MYSILDIETTGGKYNEEGITEIAIHKFDGHRVVDQFISLVNPEREIQPFVVNLTGINSKMLQSAPKFHEVAKRIVEITEGTTLVAHNAQFDYRILRTEFRRLGYNYERKTLCTVDLAKQLIPEAESHSLGKLVRSLGIPVSDRHRANGDALATLKLFKVLLSKDLDKTIIREVTRGETLGELSQRQLRIVDQMPSATGVYYMFNKYKKIIYLGKSIDIKKRVNEHFTSDRDICRYLQKEARKVTYELTGNELVAYLKVNEEIKRNPPKYPVISDDRTLLSNPNGEDQSSSDRYSLAGKDVMVLDKGREVGERSAILIRNGQLKGMGFYELNHQIGNMHILESILTPLQGSKEVLQQVELYLTHKKVVDIIEINSPN